MPFQIKLLFSLIKLHIWAKAVTLIQLNHHCLQLLSRAEWPETFWRPRRLVNPAPTRQCVGTKGDTTLFQQHFQLWGWQCEWFFPVEISSAVITTCVPYWRNSGASPRAACSAHYEPPLGCMLTQKRTFSLFCWGWGCLSPKWAIIHQPWWEWVEIRRKISSPSIWASTHWVTNLPEQLQLRMV